MKDGECNSELAIKYLTELREKGYVNNEENNLQQFIRRRYDLSFKFEDLHDNLFEKLIAFSYSMGSGLGGPGVIIMLTSDRKEYVIGQEG